MKRSSNTVLNGLVLGLSSTYTERTYACENEQFLKKHYYHDCSFVYLAQQTEGSQSKYSQYIINRFLFNLL
jgi:hypothetical protein